MEIEKECWCGCKSFSIRLQDAKPYRIAVKCNRCKAERTVHTPGVAVPEYEIVPKFAEAREKSE